MAALTLIVTLLGAAGLYAFERETSAGYGTYSEALWRTAMVITTMGSAAEPQTPEGRTLFFLLALYSFTFFGYITATLASFFVGREDAAGTRASVFSGRCLGRSRHCGRSCAGTVRPPPPRASSK